MGYPFTLTSMLVLATPLLQGWAARLNGRLAAMFRGDAQLTAGVTGNAQI